MTSPLLDNSDTLHRSSDVAVLDGALYPPPGTDIYAANSEELRSRLRFDKLPVMNIVFILDQFEDGGKLTEFTATGPSGLIFPGIAATHDHN
jgi:hypothetical protein